MLRVTIDLIPFGIEEKKRCLGMAEIWNDVSGTVDTGNYKFKLLKWGTKNSIWKSGEVENFPRLKLGPWDLLFRVLLCAVGSRNNKVVVPESDP